MGLLSEIKTLHKFFKTMPPSERRVVFYAEHAGYFLYFEGLIEKLTHQYRQTIAYVTSDPQDPILATQNPYIQAFCINRLLPFFMRVVDAQVFVMTLTDLNQFHLKRSFHPVHYVYIPHSLVSTHMAFRRGSFDHYDTILCVGPHHVKEIRRHEELARLNPKTLVKAGYYPLEKLYQAYAERGPSADAVPKTVLIAPSWGEKNILELCGEELIAILLNAGYDVIVRPHFETMKRSPELIARLRTAFDGNPSFVLETSVAGDELLIRSDVLIGDWSGVSLKYAFGTERPVLFIDVPPKAKNPQYGELGLEPIELGLRPHIGLIASPEHLEQVPELLSQLISDKESYRKELADLRSRYVFSFGPSSEIGSAYIMDLAQKQKSSPQ